MDMKRVKYILLAFLAVFTLKVYGDVIIASYSPTKICVKIDNLGEYPDMAIVGLSDCMAIFFTSKANTMDSKSSFEVPKACPLTFYAVKKDYLEKKGIGNINWKKDENVLRSGITIIAKKVRVSYPNVETLEMNIAIRGFDGNSVVMYKKSETYKFNDGKPDLVRF